ncbi:MAG: hypothetical protein ACLQJR_28100 [Stellaceae bacterium]
MKWWTLLAIFFVFAAAPAFGRGHGGGHGGGGHSAVPMCAGCQHRKLCRFDEIIEMKASCFGLGAERPKSTDKERR